MPTARCGRPRGTRARSRSRSGVRAIQAAHGRDAVGVFGGGALTNEKAYLLGKFARVALRHRQHRLQRPVLHVVGAPRRRSAAFGLDRGLPFPLEDIPHADAILLVGGNPAETMPPLMQYFEAQQRERRHSSIVVDPRRTPTAQWATLHLR